MPQAAPADAAVRSLNRKAPLTMALVRGAFACEEPTAASAALSAASATPPFEEQASAATDADGSLCRVPLTACQFPALARASPARPAIAAHVTPSCAGS